MRWNRICQIRIWLYLRWCLLKQVYRTVRCVHVLSADEIISFESIFIGEVSIHKQNPTKVSWLAQCSGSPFIIPIVRQEMWSLAMVATPFVPAACLLCTYAVGNSVVWLMHKEPVSLIQFCDSISACSQLHRTQNEKERIWQASEHCSRYIWKAVFPCCVLKLQLCLSWNEISLCYSLCASRKCNQLWSEFKRKFVKLQWTSGKTIWTEWK